MMIEANWNQKWRCKMAGEAGAKSGFKRKIHTFSLEFVIVSGDLGELEKNESKLCRMEACFKQLSFSKQSLAKTTYKLFNCRWCCWLVLGSMVVAPRRISARFDLEFSLLAGLTLRVACQSVDVWLEKVPHKKS
jgi:hypothetical protein